MYTREYKVGCLLAVHTRTIFQHFRTNPLWKNIIYNPLGRFGWAKAVISLIKVKLRLRKPMSICMSILYVTINRLNLKNGVMTTPKLHSVNVSFLWVLINQLIDL